MADEEEVLRRYNAACAQWWRGGGWKHLSPHLTALNEAIERPDWSIGLQWEQEYDPASLVATDPVLKRIRKLARMNYLRNLKLPRALPAIRFGLSEDALTIWTPGLERMLPSSTWYFWRVQTHNSSIATTIEKIMRTILDEMSVTEDDLENWLSNETGVEFHSWHAEPFWPAGETEEQRGLREYQAELGERDASPAGVKARDLLLSHLDEQQQEDYLTKRYFYVVKWGPLENVENLPSEKRKVFRKVKDGENTFRYRRYRIDGGYVNGNVHLMNGVSPRRLRTFCLHPPDVFPSDDTLLAQKMLIEADEWKFLTDANWSSPGVRPDFVSYARQLRHR